MLWWWPGTDRKAVEMSYRNCFLTWCSVTRPMARCLTRCFIFFFVMGPWRNMGDVIQVGRSIYSRTYRILLIWHNISYKMYWCQRQYLKHFPQSELPFGDLYNTTRNNLAKVSKHLDDQQGSFSLRLVADKSHHIHALFLTNVSLNKAWSCSQIALAWDAVSSYSFLFTSVFV